MRRFGQPLTLNVGPSELHLASRSRAIRIPADGGPFGALFGGRAADDPPPYARLVAALRWALRECAVGPVRPSVTVRRIEALDAALGGYQAFILECALRDSGAAQVTFEPPHRDMSDAPRR